MRINENILISSLTTMRIGGPARFVIEVERPEEVTDAFNFAKQYNLPTFMLGYGANTIGHDEGYNGVIIINRMRGIEIISEAKESENESTGGQDSFAEDRKLGRAPLSVSETEDSEDTSTGGQDSSAEDRRLGRAPLSVSEAKESDHRKTTIRVMGGEPWDNVVAFACEKGLTGIEALSRIPGLAAAAPVQNIGAYGQEIADTLVSIDTFDTATGTMRTLTKSDLHFSYRKSILNTTEKNRYFVISITLALKQGQMPRPFYNSIENYISIHNLNDFSPEGIRTIVSTIRADKLPDPLVKASAGSFFKNIYLNTEEAEKAEDKGYPVHHGKDGHKINSAWLIEQAGLKGQLFNGFRVSETAPLVLINESATTYQELATARGAIVGKVYDKFGYWLEQEPVELQ